MPLKKPNSMDECHYFTNRTLEGEKGRIMAWVFRKECPKCKKGTMSKPLKKNGKIDKKSPNDACSKCGFQMPVEEAETGLAVNIDYKCPKCGNEGEATTEYKRKSFQGVQAFIFSCQKCSEKIPITKKLKEIKKKGKEDAGEGVGGE